MTHQHLADGEFEPGRKDIVGILRAREVGDVRLGTHGDLCDRALQILVADFFGDLPFVDVPLFFARRNDAGSERRITALRGFADHSEFADETDFFAVLLLRQEVENLSERFGVGDRKEDQTLEVFDGPVVGGQIRKVKSCTCHN